MKMKSYISDPEWNSSFIGRFIYIYKGSGDLEWNPNTLIYTDKKRQIKIEKNNIIEIKIGTYSRIAKPIPLNFIELKYKGEKFQEKRLFFTPTLPNKNPWFIPVWKTNKYVRKCIEEIKEWKNS